MLFSPSSKYLALVGESGISVLEMPMRWGKFAAYDGGSEEVICRYTCTNKTFELTRDQLDEKLFKVTGAN